MERGKLDMLFIADSIGTHGADDLDSMRRACVELISQGAANVLIKGGHLEHDAVDILCTEGTATLSAGSGALKVAKGESCYLPARDGAVTASGPAVLFIAGSGIGS